MNFVLLLMSWFYRILWKEAVRRWGKTKAELEKYKKDRVVIVGTNNLLGEEAERLEADNKELELKVKQLENEMVNIRLKDAKAWTELKREVVRLREDVKETLRWSNEDGTIYRLLGMLGLHDIYPGEYFQENNKEGDC